MKGAKKISDRESTNRKEELFNQHLEFLKPIIDDMIKYILRDGN